jgi:hypothetical protein
MKAVSCYGDYYGKFTLVSNDSTTTLPFSTVDSNLISVKTPSGSKTTLIEYISGSSNFTGFDPASGYIVFARQPFVLQDFQSQSIVSQIDIPGDILGKYTIFRYPFVNSLPISSYNVNIYEVKTTSSENSILRTHSPSNNINPFTEFEFNKYYLIRARNNFSIINPDPSITADLQVGSISAGEVVPGGTNLQGFIDQLVRTIFEPTFVEPTVYAVTDLPTSVEVGTTGVVLSAVFNSGAIVGALVGGIWNPLMAQDVRSGAITNYTLSGVSNNTTPYLSFPTKVIEDGSNTFAVSATYSQGPQPLNNRNNNFSAPLLAGTVTSSITINGKRKAFYGVNIGTLNSPNIRALTGNVLGPQKGTSFTINIPIGTTNVAFAYPSSLGAVSKVSYYEGFEADVKENFTLTTVQVSGLNDYTPINYNTYTYAPVEPFSEEVNYIVTI